jgi:phage gp29-like protein
MVTENRGEITIEAGDPEWVVYEPFGPHGWLHGALMRSVATPWIVRYWTRTWWARHQEVHGQPLRLGVIPATRDPADERRFLSQLSNLAHEAVIRLPQGSEDNRFDVKLLEASSNTWQGFDALLKHCDDSIAIAILGQSQSTRGQGGLGTQENAGESTMMRITRRDALLSDVLREQVLMPWAEANYGSAEAAPYLVWDNDPPEDKEKTAQAAKTVADALVAFKNAGAPLDVRTYLEQLGYPLLSEDEHAAQKQEAVEAARKAMGNGEAEGTGDDDGPPGKPGTGPNLGAGTDAGSEPAAE